MPLKVQIVSNVPKQWDEPKLMSFQDDTTLQKKEILENKVESDAKTGFLSLASGSP